jgi:DNA transformation protein
MDPKATYERLRTPAGALHDLCVLDVFLAAHDFMNGGPAQPWWRFTAQRKRTDTKDSGKVTHD